MNRQTEASDNRLIIVIWHTGDTDRADDLVRVPSSVTHIAPKNTKTPFLKLKINKRLHIGRFDLHDQDNYCRN